MNPRPIIAIALGGLIAVSQGAAAQIATPAPPAEPLAPSANVADQYLSIQEGHHLTSDLIGQTVYSGATADSVTIGDINDLVVTEDGSILAAVIGVGGFLGVGEKSVAVAYNSLEWHMDENGGRFATLFTTKEELESAPAFDVSALGPNQTSDPTDPTTSPIGGPGLLDYPTDIAELPSTDPQNSPSESPQTGDVVTVSAADLMGTTVMSADNESVGNINDVILTQDGRIDAVVVDVGGFLGLGAKPVAIAFESLTIQSDENNNLQAFVDFTKTQLELAPGYSKPEYNGQRDTMRLTSRV